MKLSFAAFLLAYPLTPLQGVSGYTCGKWTTNDCIGETDKRYDPDYTSNIKELDDIWGKYEGFWALTVLNYNATGLPGRPRHVDEDATNGGNAYARFPSFGFANITISGSRLYQHRYLVHPPAPTDFCDEPIPSGQVNVISPGVCGVNGFSWFQEVFGTTSYEKDGSVVAIGTTTSQLPEDFIRPVGTYTSYPVDEKSLYSSTSSAVTSTDLLTTETVVFTDDEATRASSVTDYYASAGPPIGNVLLASNRIAWIRLASEDAFNQAILDSYMTYNVPPEQQVPVPMQGDCLADRCPTEEDWCQSDPTCSESPYQEPDGTVKAGVIAGFTILGFLIVVGVLVWWHFRNVRKRDERNRVKFARRVAETVELRGSARQLTPEGLVKEFDAIASKNKDGYISKEELWEFVSSGKAGEMDKKDFEALYAVMDVNKNGTVDFMEFCAFMGKCDVEFESVKNRQSVVAARLSTKKLAAEALSSKKLVTEDVVKDTNSDEDNVIEETKADMEADMEA